MDGISAKKLARDLGMRAEYLIRQLNEIGIEIEVEDALVTGVQQLALLQHLRTRESEASGKREFSMEDVRGTLNLRSLNQLLTQAMAERKIQTLIKDDNLDMLIASVLKLSFNEDEQLLAAAMLGRLAAVARGREASVYAKADEVLTREPGSMESLDDGDAKQYAAQMIAHVNATWVPAYAYREALSIDTADNARKELLTVALGKQDNIASWLASIKKHASALNGINNEDTRLKRVRRICSSMRDVTERWRGDVGIDAGVELAGCMKALLTGRLSDLDQVVLYETLDYLLAILGRIIELRFSTALHAFTYSMLEQAKRELGPGSWVRMIDQSQVIPQIRIALLESALVLARQNRSDKKIIAVLLACYISKTQVSAAIKRHFKEARDLDPDVADWWRNAGDVSDMQRLVEQKIGNNEDSQIGALLIEVESNHDAMDKVGRAVVPLLEISEPVLASTVKKAVDGYQGIAQTARRLARMRKLTKTDLKGERLEYNPLEHEMLGGHIPGVRRVKVVRDGIKKEFAGKIKTLVKPWVEPDE